jgi:hypothetical protein
VPASTLPGRQDQICGAMSRTSSLRQRPGWRAASKSRPAGQSDALVRSDEPGRGARARRQRRVPVSLLARPRRSRVVLLLVVTRLGWLVDRARSQQHIQQADHLARRQDQSALVGMLGRLHELGVRIVAILWAVRSYPVGCLDQGRAQKRMARFGQGGSFPREVTRFPRLADQPRKRGHRRRRSQSERYRRLLKASQRSRPARVRGRSPGSGVPRVERLCASAIVRSAARKCPCTVRMGARVVFRISLSGSSSPAVSREEFRAACWRVMAPRCGSAKRPRPCW